MINVNTATLEQIARSNKIKLDKLLTNVYKDDTFKPTCTPEELANEMIDKLPNLDGEILILSDAPLLVAVLRNLKNSSKTYEQVTFIAHNEKQQAFSQELGIKTFQIGYNNPIEELEKQLMGMKFDIVIGNPPYAAGANKSFYTRFIDLTYKISKNGIIAMVTPNTWISNSKDKPSSLFREMDSVGTFILIKEMDAHEIFHIALGSRISYFIFSARKLPIKTIRIRLSNSNHEDPLILKLLKNSQKPISGKGNITSGEKDPLQFEQSAAHTFPIFLSSKKERQLVWGSTKAPGTDKMKLIVSHIMTPGKAEHFSKISKELGVGRYCSFFECETEEEAENIRSFFNSKTYTFLDSKLRAGRYAFLTIPQYDFNCPWDDNVFYKSMNLAAEEIEEIEVIENEKTKS